MVRGSCTSGTDIGPRAREAESPILKYLDLLIQQPTGLR
jgi:hypothetical protein